MTANHQTILAELYEIDPGLREHEAELIPLIKTLLERDPAQKPSPAFVKKLRKELHARAAAAMNGAVEHRVSYASPSGFFHRFAYALAGATAAVVIAVPVTMQYVNRDALAPVDDGSEIALKTTGIAESDQHVSNPVSDGYATAPGGVPYGRGGGGGGVDATAGISSLIAPWNPVRYRLEGDLPQLDESVTVLERRLGRTNVPFSSIQNAFDIDRVDLSSFDGANVESVTIAQDVPFGYYINVSLTDGSVSINQKWDRWPHPENDCRDEACFQRLRPSLSDIPADAELIRIASQFLNDHEVDLTGYGSPTVDHAWRQAYDATEDKRYAWVPDTIRVVYPLIVDGQTVIEAGGEAAGISVQVSIRHDRVTDVWGLMAYQFDRETHDGVTERAQVEEFLDMAGMHTPEAPVVTVSNPREGFVRIYTYEDNRNREYFVPALLFDVTGVPPTIGYYPRTVAVPLSEELMGQAQPPVIIDPVPMPRPIDPAATEPLIEEDVPTNE